MARREKPVGANACGSNAAANEIPARKAPSREAIEKALEVWQPHYARRLSQEDAREILENAVGFFRILREWQAQERKSEIQ
ncbi:MAG TPA: hypothetical protein DDZ68_04525 [Parvularcula sp.]|nr:hypothetical protein [Parvularcula sp.]